MRFVLAHKAHSGILKWLEKLLAVFVVDTNRDGIDDPIRELRFSTFRMEILLR